MKAVHINLLPKREKSLVDSLMYFLLHYFRYIVVLTQIVVISVFFARFKLDQEIIDNRESFLQKQDIIEVASPLIEDALLIEEKQKHIKKIIQKQERMSMYTTEVFLLVPEGVTIFSYTIQNDRIIVEGMTNSIDLVSQFYNRLKKEENYTKVNLVNVDGTIYEGFTFSVELQ